MFRSTSEGFSFAKLPMCPFRGGSGCQGQVLVPALSPPHTRNLWQRDACDLRHWDLLLSNRTAALASAP